MKAIIAIVFALITITLLLGCDDNAREENNHDSIQGDTWEETTEDTSVEDVMDDSLEDLEITEDVQELEDMEVDTGPVCNPIKREDLQIKMYRFFSENQYTQPYLECSGPFGTGFPDVEEGSELEQALSCCYDWRCELMGFATGVWLPEDFIVRADVLLLLEYAFRLNDEVPEGTQSYPDVRPEDYFYNAVEVLTQLGLLTAEADGYLNPTYFATDCWVEELLATDSNENGVPNLLEDYPLAEAVNLTRGNVAMRLVETYLQCTVEAGTQSYPDVPEPEAVDPSDPGYEAYLEALELWEAVECIVQNNLLNGYPDGHFSPDGTINRAELAKAFMEASDLPLQFSGHPFLDVPDGEWFTNWVSMLHYWHLTPDRLVFRPADIAYEATLEAWLAAEPTAP
ncbi:S-layer homology domain-containing protein [Patescibacteria group bacterium]